MTIVPIVYILHPSEHLSSLVLKVKPWSAMRVLISGAGIAGPTLAWFLAKTGSHVTVVEKADTLLAVGQNIDISHSAITIAKKMGVMDRIRQLNTTEKGTRFIDAKGRPFAPLPVRPNSQVSFTAEFEILRGDLALVLYEASKDSPNVSYIFGTTIKKVISNNDDAVKVELSNGEVHEYDLLVAADGQWSKIRKQCFPPETVTTIDIGMYAMYWTIPRLSSDDDWWNIYNALGSRIMSIRPDPHGTMRAMLTRMPRTEAHKKVWAEASRGTRQTQQDLMRREFADAGWQAQRLLDTMKDSPDFYFHSIQQIKMSKWSLSRIVCLGDAAYAPTPLTGAGASLAIIGAYCLAGELSKLDAGEHPSRALNAYDTVFRPFVEDTQKLSLIFRDMAHPETAWKRWLLHTSVWAISKAVAVPWIANRTGQTEDEDFVLPEYPGFV